MASKNIDMPVLGEFNGFCDFICGAFDEVRKEYRTDHTPQKR